MRKAVLPARVLVHFTLAIIVDQLSKGYAQKVLAGVTPVNIAKGAIRFEYVENTGGFLGYFLAVPEPIRGLLLTAGVGVILVAFIVFLLRHQRLSFTQLLASALIIAGGMSNLIDRLIHNGGVIDFVAIKLGPFSTGIFNVADIYILGGGFYLGYSLTRSHAVTSNS